MSARRDGARPVYLLVTAALLIAAILVLLGLLAPDLAAPRGMFWMGLGLVLSPIVLSAAAWIVGLVRAALSDDGGDLRLAVWTTVAFVVSLGLSVALIWLFLHGVAGAFPTQH